MSDDFIKTKLEEWQLTCASLHTDITAVVEGGMLTKGKVADWLERAMLLSLNINVVMKRIYAVEDKQPTTRKKIKRG